MMQGVHILSSRMLGQMEQLTATADNVANVNTTGFKKLVYDFEKTTGKVAGQEVGDFAKGSGVTVDYSSGPIEKTGNPLDAAIIGDAFFAVEVNGQTQYTRNGHFLTGPNGALVDGSGNPVLDNSGSAITVPVSAKSVNITPEGAISTEDGVVAVLGLYSVNKADSGRLMRAGNGGFIAPTDVTVSNADASIMIESGMLETSNVSPVAEIVKLQELNRAYQSAYKALKGIEDVQEKAIRNLAAMPN